MEQSVQLRPKNIFSPPSRSAVPVVCIRIVKRKRGRTRIVGDKTGDTHRANNWNDIIIESVSL